MSLGTLLLTFFSGFANRIILFDVSRQLGVSPCPHRLHLVWWFMTGDDFALQGTFGKIWRCFWLLQLTGGGTIGIWRVESREPAKHSTEHRMAPATRDYLTLNVVSARGEDLALEDGIHSDP